jgi:hypothetical protein
MNACSGFSKQLPRQRQAREVRVRNLLKFGESRPTGVRSILILALVYARDEEDLCLNPTSKAKFDYQLSLQLRQMLMASTTQAR